MRKLVLRVVVLAVLIASLVAPVGTMASMSAHLQLKADYSKKLEFRAEMISFERLALSSLGYSYFKDTPAETEVKALTTFSAMSAAKSAEDAYADELRKKGSNVPNGVKGCRSYFKSWMRAMSVTHKASGQWKLLHSQNCYEDPKTHFMMYICDDGEVRICCALGSYYTSLIGTKVDILFDDGHIIKCILADQKANRDTDKNNQFHLCDGSVLEFVVGTGFKGDNHYPDWTKGKLYRIEVLDAVNDGEGFRWD